MCLPMHNNYYNYIYIYIHIYITGVGSNRLVENRLGDEAIRSRVGEKRGVTVVCTGGTFYLGHTCGGCSQGAV